MLQYHVTIGLAPIRRDVTPRPGIFNWEKAEERGRHIVEYIETQYAEEHVTYVDLKGINPVDVMYNDDDVDAVIQRFQAEKVDAIVLINCNFGNEEIAGRVAKELGKPVLLWAPVDDVFEPDGTRYTDSQCGIFGMSRHECAFQLHRKLCRGGQTVSGGAGAIRPGGLYGEEFHRAAGGAGWNAAEAFLLGDL